MSTSREPANYASDGRPAAGAATWVNGEVAGGSAGRPVSNVSVDLPKLREALTSVVGLL